jgi:hypothetical protein
LNKKLVSIQQGQVFRCYYFKKLLMLFNEIKVSKS